MRQIEKKSFAAHCGKIKTKPTNTFKPQTKKATQNKP
jgi:hypothetical protein